MSLLQRKLYIFRLERLLCGSDGAMQQINADMLRLLTLRGGHYTVYTERSAAEAEALLAPIAQPDAPMFCDGGAAMYRWGERKPMRKAGISSSEAGAVIWALHRAFPSLGILVRGFSSPVWVLHANAQTALYLKSCGYGGVLVQLDELPAEWANVILCGSSELLREVEDYLIRNVLVGHFQTMRYGSQMLYFTAPQRELDALWDVLDEETQYGKENWHAMGSLPQDRLWMTHTGSCAAAGDALTELRLAADAVMTCRTEEGAAAEYLYSVLR